jgi:multicomponent Na+:H+ antiporter subunit C
MAFPGLFNYWVVVVLMMIGFYVVIAQGNQVKKIFGLNIFQVSVFVLYGAVTLIRTGLQNRWVGLISGRELPPLGQGG